MVLLIPVVMAATGLGQAQPGGQTVLPTPPRTFIDTSYRPPTGRTISVAKGGDLQGALKAAQPGDVLALEPGAVFQGNFGLPKKTGTGWIIVRSGAADDKLPPPGTRVTPGLAPLMPKLVSPDSNPAVHTEPGAHHYRFIGIEFTTASTVKDIYSIVALGGEQTADVDTPRDLILDRCYVHGQPQTMSRRGILLNGASSAVIDSHVSEIHAAGADSQAILGYNGPGPFKIVNNYLEASTENVMFGGADPKVQDLVPSDIEIRRNHIFKPLRWRPGDPSFAGVNWPIKNLLELKNAQRVLIEGNFLENNWGGAALVLTPRNQDGRAPWSVVQDVLFRSNLVANASSGFSLQTSDDERPSQPTKRIAIVNNAWGVTRTFFGLTGGRGGSPEDLLIDHNTAIPSGYSAYYIEVGRPPAMVRLRMTNNLIGFGSFGVSSPKRDPQWFPGASIARNALVSMADFGDGQGATRNRPPDIDQSMYRSFPSAAAAGLNPDGTLTATSPNRGAGIDGKDIGVDFDQLLRAYTGESNRK
ncbi:MAG TPA: hypothetical protein VJX92_21505 [Methylomirabilota bacterium]|nr:hypothetical protein [Methylomirabilota bacterium]